MAKYVSILRGINVSGHNIIRMKDLLALYEGFGFRELKTYIQSGNVLFDTDGELNDATLSRDLQAAIKTRFGYEVPVIIRSVAALKTIIGKNPFLKNAGVDPEKLHVTFLSGKPEAKCLADIRAFEFPPDEYSIIGTEVFLHCPINYGETKLSNKFFESKLKVTATTRNWKTVNKLLDMAT